MHNNKSYSFDEILSKLMRYCSYQERSLFEIRQKARTLGANNEESQRLIKALEEDGFFNEKRFVEAYVRGKLKIKRWGKYKIIEGLYAKGVSKQNIEEAVEAIPAETYKDNLKYLLDKRKVTGCLSPDEVAKHFRYFLSKGYESTEIEQLFREKKWMKQ